MSSRFTKLPITGPFNSRCCIVHCGLQFCIFVSNWYSLSTVFSQRLSLVFNKLPAVAFDCFNLWFPPASHLSGDYSVHSKLLPIWRAIKFSVKLPEVTFLCSGNQDEFSCSFVCLPVSLSNQSWQFCALLVGRICHLWPSSETASVVTCCSKQQECN